jgi:hypothetical protein
LGREYLVHVALNGAELTVLRAGHPPGEGERVRVWPELEQLHVFAPEQG